MTQNKKDKMVLLTYILTIVLEVFAFLIRPNRYDKPDWAFYTVIANYIALGSAIIGLIFYKNRKMEQTVAAIRFMAMIMLTLTFIMVVFVLVWFTDPMVLLFDKNNFIHHIFAPLGTLVSYYNFETRVEKKGLCYLAVFVSLIYSAFIVYFNIIGELEGPYPFFMTERFGIPVVIVCCFGIAAVMWGMCTFGFKFKGIKK